jgi:hypothetical protein
VTKKSDYSKPKEQWILRYDAQAVAARGAKETPKYSVEEAQAILRAIAMFAVSTDKKDLPVLALLKKKGIDAAFFATFAHYQDRLNALSIAGAADPRVEVVVSPAEKQRVEEIYEVFSALRGAAGKAGESVGRAEDAKPIGRGNRVVHTAPGVLAALLQFLTNAKLVEPLLDDAAIGEEELTEIQGFVSELQTTIANKQVREQSKDNRAEDIELTLLAADAAIDLYRSRAATATRHNRDLLPRALAAFPRAPERRKPAAPPETKTPAKTDTSADPKTETKAETKGDAKVEAGAETSAKPQATGAAPSDAPTTPTAATPA